MKNDVPMIHEGTLIEEVEEVLGVVTTIETISEEEKRKGREMVVRLALTIPDMVLRALFVATVAHHGTFDKSGVPYIKHPQAVADMLDTPEEKAAGLLHDVVEDTFVRFDDLVAMRFPKEVTDAVYAETRQIRGGQKEKYFDYIRRIKRSGPIAINVKKADLKHNSSPERLANLPPEQRDISKRYEKAMKILNGEME